jgi:protein-S-isoprenylcysteine O-methyltransferase Ste14
LPPSEHKLGAHRQEAPMHLLDQRTIGIAILSLLAILVAVKRAATGSALDRPTGAFVVQVVNAFNLSFLLVVNPLVAVLLIGRRLAAIDPTHVIIAAPWMLTAVEAVGAALYVGGLVLMAGALITLGRNYQLGGSAPRPEDGLVVAGPYRLIRHPMYTAALSMSLGLACLIQSWALACVFAVYVVLVLLLIPPEEDGLRRAYGAPYVTYQRGARKLVPFVY